METITISAFTIGITQLFNKLFARYGVNTEWCVLVAALVGAAATVLSLFQPELWASITQVCIGLTATGLISFANDTLPKIAPKTVTP